jgi:hypothetical protein
VFIHLRKFSLADMQSQEKTSRALDTLRFGRHGGEFGFNQTTHVSAPYTAVNTKHSMLWLDDSASYPKVRISTSGFWS